MEIDALKKRISALERLLNLYDNPHTPPSMKRMGGKSYGGMEEERPQGVPGRREGHEGTTRPFKKPEETIASFADKCPHCGRRAGGPTGFVRRLIEDVPEPRPLKVTEFVLARYTCNGCGKRFVSSHQDCPKKGRMGKNVTAISALLKHKGRLTNRNVSDMLKIQHGMDVAPATVMKMADRAADAMRNEYMEIEERLADATMVNADETSVPVNGKNFWYWTFVAGNDVFCTIDRSRGKAVPERVLEGFGGILTTDGWKPYAGLPCRKQRCWAHLLREADSLAEAEEEAMELAVGLRMMMESAEHYLADAPPHERLAMHAEFMAWMDGMLGTEYASAKVQKFVEKIRNGRNAWFTFITHPGVEPTNCIVPSLMS